MKQVKATNLLSPAQANYKLAKGLTSGEFTGMGLFLSPQKLSGMGNLCPFASAGCIKTCINTAGHGIVRPVQRGRLRKTVMFFENKPLFFATLKAEIEKLIRKGTKENKKVFIRLNGTSDIRYENFKVYDGKNIFEAFPSVIFYDYSKDIQKTLSNKEPNYHITFSKSEVNDKEVRQALDARINVAVVFKGKVLPKTYLGHKVINGDESDLRFLEGRQGLIIGLTAKGKARYDTTGFAVDLSVNTLAKAS